MIQAQAIHHNEFRIPSAEKTGCCFLNSRICLIAAKAFLNISIALSINFAVMSFVATPLSVTFMTGLIISTTIIAIIHSSYEICKGQKTHKTSYVNTISQASMINTLGLAGPNIAIHEGGHAFLASAMFKNAKPEISIFPFNGGSTSYIISNGLTKIGNFFGKYQALIVITAAGMMASTLFAMFEFAIANKLKESYPLISEFLTIHGIIQIFNEIIYALTAFVASKADLAHDFVCLWEMGGIHPLIPITFMIALPLIEFSLFKFFNNKKCSEKVNELVCNNV